MSITSACSLHEAHGEEAMLALGRQFARCLKGRQLITLCGDLGAGKTTFTRGVLRGLGFEGSVKSPTYTLVEPYVIGAQQLYHFDLYRLADAEELEFMGFRDYLREGNFCLVEWPERGEGFLPQADIAITISTMGRGRQLMFESFTEQGAEILACLDREASSD